MCTQMHMNIYTLTSTQSSTYFIPVLRLSLTSSSFPLLSHLPSTLPFPFSPSPSLSFPSPIFPSLLPPHTFSW